jgi:hypothetical protein
LSPVEQIYNRNVVAEKLKHGTKYERLTALVVQILDADATVIHDVRLRGDGKRTVHQIDVHVSRGDENRRVIIECRDKTGSHKVTLDEARSFATVARQLQAVGAMVTTTDFTRAARSLAEDEEIHLFTLRPFLDADREGRLMAIDLTIRAIAPDFVAVQVFSPDGQPGREQRLSGDASVIAGASGTLGELLYGLLELPLEPTVNDLRTSTATFDPPVIVAGGEGPVSITKIRVDYRLAVHEETIRVDAGRRIAELVLRSLDGKVDKVVWDRDLQRHAIDPQTGTVVPRPAPPG